MTARTCDRCGKLYAYGKKPELELMLINNRVGIKHIFDFCKDCREAFRQFMSLEKMEDEAE